MIVEGFDLCEMDGINRLWVVPAFPPVLEIAVHGYCGSRTADY